jgi:hypothetical protein
MFTDNVRGQPPVPDKGVLARYPLIFYFIIAYAGSWLVVLPYLRSPGGAGLLPFNWPIPFPVSAALAPFAGPCFAAFIMTGVTQGSAGICRLLRRIVLWRVGVWWYLFALVGIPAITVLGALVLPGVLVSWQTPASSLLRPIPSALLSRSSLPRPLRGAVAKRAENGTRCGARGTRFARRVTRAAPGSARVHYETLPGAGLQSPT